MSVSGQTDPPDRTLDPSGVARECETPSADGSSSVSFVASSPVELASSKDVPSCSPACGALDCLAARLRFLLAFALRPSLRWCWRMASLTSMASPEQAANCCLSTRSCGPSKWRAFFFGTGRRGMGAEESGKVSDGAVAGGGGKVAVEGGETHGGVIEEDPSCSSPVARVVEFRAVLGASGNRGETGPLPNGPEGVLEPSSQPWPAPAAAAVGVPQDSWA